VSRVLLVCPEPLGHRNPAGVGIRFLELARALVADGHRVEVLSPDGGAVPGCGAGAISPEALRSATAGADVTVVQGHAVNDVLAFGIETPLVVDLYDPYIVENFHYWGERGDGVFRHDHATLMASLAAGDLFLCASEAQRMFYAGLLVAAGRINPDLFESDPTVRSLIRIVPFGVQPPRVPARPSGAASREIFFGAVYDWYDPFLAVDAVTLAREQEPELTLTFTHHPNADITPQSLFGRLRERVESGAATFVKLEPWIAYDDRAAFYDRFGIALLTFRPSLETDLAMRTRMFDCFWGDLPVVTSSAGGTDPLIARYGSGEVVAGTNPRDYAMAIVDLLRSPRRYEEAVAGCRRFTADHQWARLLEPLLEFCRAPRRDRTRDAFSVPPPRLGGHPEGRLRKLRRRLRGAF
jgi:glycosyltransferase involved in cell wall biosynthesis